jgi:hypothetical protein
MSKRLLLPLAGALLLAGCATLPTGPNVMVLPGTEKDFGEFQLDDTVCRQWAAQQTGAAPSQAANQATAASAVAGTALGAAAGAAVGAAAGNPALGAAVGAGTGLLGGTAVGAGQGAATQWTLQQRYDIAYMQCMYAKGNQIPIPAGMQPAQTGRASSKLNARGNLPPPPPGSPPPPPPGVW